MATLGELSKNFSKLFSFSPGNETLRPRIYPPSVLEARGNYGREELESLVYNGFLKEAIYLVTKTLSKQPEVQKDFLQKVLDLFSKADDGGQSLSNILLETIASLSPQTEIVTSKLAIINKYGSEYWHSRFQEMIRETIKQFPTHTPVIIANAPFFAFEDFVKYYQGTGTHRYLYCMCKDWLKENSGIPYFGYRIDLSLSMPHIELIPSELFTQTVDSIVLFDDIRREGKTYAEVMEYIQNLSTIKEIQFKTVSDFYKKAVY